MRFATNLLLHVIQRPASLTFRFSVISHFVLKTELTELRGEPIQIATQNPHLFLCVLSSATPPISIPLQNYAKKYCDQRRMLTPHIQPYNRENWRLTFILRQWTSTGLLNSLQAIVLCSTSEVVQWTQMLTETYRPYKYIEDTARWQC